MAGKMYLARIVAVHVGIWGSLWGIWWLLQLSPPAPVKPFPPYDPTKGAADEVLPVSDDWALKIVIFPVGQADAAVLLARNGEAAIVDLGHSREHGQMVAEFLLNASENGVGSISDVEYLFISHYDADHIGGVNGLAEKVRVKEAIDRGHSLAQDPSSRRTRYGRYVRFVGDPNGNGIMDSGEEDDFRRTAAYPGLERGIGSDDRVLIRVLSLNGTTVFPDHRIIGIDPTIAAVDENPGSMALYVRWGEFEYLTCGDATSSQWKSEPDTERLLIESNAIPGGDDVDVLKVNHHGSDTSTGLDFIAAIAPEVAVVPVAQTRHHLPKLTTLKVLTDNGALVLSTGRMVGSDNRFHQSRHSYDDGFVPPRDMIFGNQGRITILVGDKGDRYTITTQDGGSWTFDARDSRNPH